jgi:hypothetical protein
MPYCNNPWSSHFSWKHGKKHPKTNHGFATVKAKPITAARTRTDKEQAKAENYGTFRWNLL